MNNKIYLITGGISVASLAAGAAGGYFFAKRKFAGELETIVAREVNETKKYYSVLLMEARDKPDDPADVITKDIHDDDDGGQAEAQEALENGAKEALTNYQGYSATGDEELVTTNIFDNNDGGKKKLPPRDPSTGHFLPKNGAKPKEATPYLIEPDEFLDNDLEHEQESVLYFVGDDTAVMASDYNEVVDNARIGAVNLTLFPDEEPSVIYVRNEGLGMDYQVTRTFDSLTVAMGFGEDESDLEGEDEDEESDLHLQH